MRLVIKAKKMPIGTISHGRKKVSEGKWVPVKSGKKKEKFTSDMLTRLRQEFSGVKRMDPEGSSYETLTTMLDTLDAEKLKQLVDAKINFVSSLARNRLSRMEPKKWYEKTSKKGKTYNFDATKLGWKRADGKAKAVEISKQHPGKYITMHDVFGQVTITVHDSLPSSPYAPGDFKEGYGRDGVWKEWSTARKKKYSNKMIEGPE